jgi:hypothetical protein
MLLNMASELSRLARMPIVAALATSSRSSSSRFSTIAVAKPGEQFYPDYIGQRAHYFAAFYGLVCPTN